MKHIDDELPLVVQSIITSPNLCITEKLDGTYVEFGIDEFGFYISPDRRKIKIRTKKECTFEAYIFAFGVLESHTLGQPNCMGSAEILFGDRPNVIHYKKNNVVVLHEWTNFKVTESDLLCKNPIIYLNIPTQYTDISELKLLLLDEIRNYSSVFGGDFMEGIVLSNGQRSVKVVDKDAFLEAKKFVWEVRDNIYSNSNGYRQPGLINKMFRDLGDLYLEPKLELSTRRKYIETATLPFNVKQTKNEIIGLLENTIANIMKYLEQCETTMLTMEKHIPRLGYSIKYDDEIISRTKKHALYHIEKLENKLKLINAAYDEYTMLLIMVR